MCNQVDIENDVLIASDGQLFLVGGAHWVLDLITGKRQVPKTSLCTFNDTIERRARLVQKSPGPTITTLFSPTNSQF